jgi:plasmid stabilization system protein ParE
MADIRGVLTWKTQRSPAAGARWHAGLLGAIRSLTTNPERCPLAYEAAELGVELRELLHGRRHSVYRVLFTFDGRTVNVLRVRHSAQDRLAPGDV